MKTHVIQYGKLEEFASELSCQDVTVRVTTLDITVSASSQIPGLRMAGIGVHVRVINDDGHILACYLPVAQLQLYNGRRDGDPLWQKYDAAWEKAEALKKRAVAYLESITADKEITIRTAGVIDMGEIRPLRATWQSDPARTKQE